MIISIPFWLRMGALRRLSEAAHLAAAADHLERAYGANVWEAAALRRDAQAHIVAARELFLIADILDRPVDPAA